MIEVMDVLGLLEVVGEYLEDKENVLDNPNNVEYDDKCLRVLLDVFEDALVKDLDGDVLDVHLVDVYIVLLGLITLLMIFCS